MKKCLWCSRKESTTTFTKIAHTIPESLGGNQINENVCDECNSYFGTKQRPNNIAIEEVLKEAFNISRERFKVSNRVYPIKKQPKRFKSRFFRITKTGTKNSIKIKDAFKFLSGFQRNLCRLFKRGLYMMYLEELNRQNNLGYENKYDFIREFARYDIGDYPVFYFERKHGIFFIIDGEAENPQLIFDRNNYLLNQFGFSEIEFLGHVFGFPTTRLHEFQRETYLNKSIESKQNFFKNIIEMKHLTDMDILLTILDK